MSGAYERAIPGPESGDPIGTTHRRSTTKPTVILVKTVKGDGMIGAEGSNTVHQKKNFDAEQRLEIARNFGIPLDDESKTKGKAAIDDAWKVFLDAHSDELGPNEIRLAGFVQVSSWEDLQRAFIAPIEKREGNNWNEGR